MFTLCMAMACAALTGCTISHGGGDSAEESETQEANPAPKVSVKDGAEDVDPSQRVEAKSQDEKLRKVVMTNQDGKEVEGEFNQDHSSWRTTEDLGYYREYTVEATDENGESTTTEFSTVNPDGVSAVALSPLDGAEVGVGQTVAFRFGYAVPDRKKAEKLLSVKTEPKVEGAFYWLNNNEVRWRPEKFWKPGTKVTAKAEIYGQSLGGGIYGDSNNEASFTIGDEVITTVDDNTKMMTVTKNGEELRSIPVSLGSSQWPTPNGTYIIGDLNESMVMDSETFGLAHDKGGYKTTVQFATQMSYSGIYVHAAPWSVWAQGNTNTSHGCINVTTEAAQWFQQTVKRGDVVKVVNTAGGEFSGWDGLGDWNIPWSEWKAGNADEG